MNRSNLITDTDELIGRKDAYIPVNMFHDPKGAAATLAHWKALAEGRRERHRKFAEKMERNARGYDCQGDTQEFLLIAVSNRCR